MSCFRTLCFLLIAFCSGAFAQTATSVIFGTVTDATGAVVPDVRVTATNSETNLSRSAQTNQQGEYRIDFLPKTKIELAVDDSIAEQVMEAVCNVARTGKTGDGKVWILDLEQALRVRTGETGPDAI